MKSGINGMRMDGVRVTGREEKEIENDKVAGTKEYNRSLLLRYHDEEILKAKTVLCRYYGSRIEWTLFLFFSFSFTCLSPQTVDQEKKRK